MTPALFCLVNNTFKIFIFVNLVCFLIYLFTTKLVFAPKTVISFWAQTNDSIDSLHKWCLNLNNNIWYILNLTLLWKFRCLETWMLGWGCTKYCYSNFGVIYENSLSLPFYLKQTGDSVIIGLVFSSVRYWENIQWKKLKTLYTAWHLLLQ